jgi:protein TonB
MQTVAHVTPSSVAKPAAQATPLEVHPDQSEPTDWHYYGIRRPSRIPWIGIAVSAAFHLVILYGIQPARPKVKKVVAEEAVIQMVMPPIKEVEEEPVKELQDDQPDQTPAVNVPTLVDMPSVVDVNVAFVQPLELRPPVQADLATAKLTTIPVNAAHGARVASAFKNVFDLSQLDRVPEPISQPPPQVPPSLRREAVSVEVKVQFIVDTDGYVHEAFVVSSTSRGFDQAAVDGVSKWRFRPGMKNGRRVNARMMVPVRFEVRESEF